jgi:hypothetical protein
MNEDPRYIKGLELFNAREFFDAHETWEELWHATQGEPRDFLQGLIQAATALHHFQNGNLKGARLLYQSFCELLAPYPKRFMGTDVKKFKNDMDVCFRRLNPYSVESLPGRYTPGKEQFPVQLEESKIPIILFPHAAA